MQKFITLIACVVAVVAVGMFVAQRQRGSTGGVANATPAATPTSAEAAASVASPAPTPTQLPAPAGDSASASMWTSYPRIAPFEALRWKDQVPDGQIDGKWYHLEEINTLPVDKIVTFADSISPNDWKKRFTEDLPELLARMGHDTGTNVTLKVKALPDGAEQVMNNVPMTEENRASLREALKQEEGSKAP